MGKKQHQKDKLYITCTEWSTLYGGKRAIEDRRCFKRLPFHCCRNILPFVKKHGINPVTGKKMKVKELIKLNFHRNSDGKFHCPVTFKVFNENTHIVAIRVTGNVYCQDAVERLNIKSNNLFDLLTSESFTRSDIITIQDPLHLEKFNITAFYHVQNREENFDNSKTVTIRQLNPETRETLAELPKDMKVPDYMFSNKPSTSEDKIIRDAFNTASYSTGKAAAAFTSTVMEPVTKMEPAILTNDLVRYKYVKAKGYVSLVTTHGKLNLELHCDLVPKACENFIRLCASGYYNDTIFHRLIRYFIFQGGDPGGTGYGGESVWGKAFEDEFRPNLLHDARGVLSMANSGPNTNQSQLVVGGGETLSKVEFIETDKDDRPLEEIRIINCEVYVDPFKDVDEMLVREREQTVKKKSAVASEIDRPKAGNRREEEAYEAELRAKQHSTSSTTKVYHQGVGQFIDLNLQMQFEKPSTIKREALPTNVNAEVAHKKQKTVIRTQLCDFSAW